jgi:hypothetical protein
MATITFAMLWAELLIMDNRNGHKGICLTEEEVARQYGNILHDWAGITREEDEFQLWLVEDGVLEDHGCCDWITDWNRFVLYAK